MTHLWKKAAALVCAAALTLPGLPLSAAAADRPIRVGYPVQPCLEQEDAGAVGYTREYLREAAQLTGWEYEFVEVEGEVRDTVPQLLEMVEDGELDLMGGMAYSEELLSYLDYSAHSYGEAEAVLLTLYEDPRNMAEQFTQTASLRVAVLEGERYLRSMLEEYCRAVRITPVYVSCGSSEEQLQAMREDRADVMLGVDAVCVPGTRTVTSFSPTPFYFVMPKGGDAELLQTLDQAMAALQEMDPGFTASLREKYFLSGDQVRHFTSSETAFIQTGPPLRVGFLADRPPYQSLDPETGEASGICADLLDYLAEYTGLTFQIVPAADSGELERLRGAGEIDLLAEFTLDYDYAQSQGVAMTRAYVTAPYTMLRKEEAAADGFAGKRLALANSRYQGEFVGVVTPYDTVLQALEAIRAGEEDYTYADVYMAQYYVNLPRYRSFLSIPQVYTPRRICFGVCGEQDPALLSVLNKAILALPIEDLQAILYRNTAYQPPVSVAGYLRDNPVAAVMGVSAVSLTVIAALTLIFTQRLRMNRRLALELRKHRKVYGLLNDYFFEYRYDKRQMMVSVPGKDGEAELRQYDFTAAGSPDVKARQDGFLSLFLGQDSGVKEALVEYTDGGQHWLRCAFQTVPDHLGRPAYTVGKLTNVDREQAALSDLKNQALRDSLTRIYNAGTSRRLIQERLAGLGERGGAALVLLDVDHFKEVNDTYGHMAGDAVLAEVAATLQRLVRADDIVGRPGGDEFMIYMEGGGDRGALERKCAAIQAAVGAITVLEGVKISASIGAALILPGETYAALYQRTDAALYRAKGAGRDRYEIA